MNVQDIIQLIANQGLGNDHPSTADQEIYLRYLNLAHHELYRSVIPLAPDRFAASANLHMVNGELAYLIDNDGNPLEDLIFAPENFVFQVISAIDITNGRKLEKTSLSDLEGCEPLLNRTGTPAYYYESEGSFFTYPLATHDVRIRYITIAQDFTLESPEIDIPYPVSYHPILIDGAIYYLFQGEGGFKAGSKAIAAQGKWARGKSSLCNFLEVQQRPPAKVEDF